MQRHTNTDHSLTFVFFILIGLIFSTNPAKAEDEPQPERLLVHLLAYLEKDYAGAVSDDGKVLSDSEYAEQQEFSLKALETSHDIKALQDKPDVLNEVKQLADLVRAKGQPGAVATLSKKLQGKIIDITKMEIAPQQWPDLAHAKELFGQQCALCHGKTGAGDGPEGSALEPKPANFLDADTMTTLSPSQAFNTIRLGVPGTGMPAFAQLSHDDVWSLASYVVSLRYQNQEDQLLSSPGLAFDASSLKLTATSSDATLLTTLAGSADEKMASLKALRLHGAADEGAGAPLQLAKRKLHDAGRFYEEGNFEAAKNAALQAYIDGIEPIEARVRATDPTITSELESKMSAVRGAIEGKQALSLVHAATWEALQKINAVESLLAGRELSAGMAFTAASAILLREGFEAVLLIIALLGVIRATGSKRASLWVHGGWVSALGCGLIAWFFSGYLIRISGAQRELVEAWTALLAVIVLLFVGFWLHSRTEIGRWNHFLKVKVQRALKEKNLFGLALISFMAVFREAFETVLFLRAIWLESGEEARTAMTTGVVVTFATLIVGAWLILRWSTRIPVRKLFAVSAVVMAALAFIFTGKGLHSLQEAGGLGVTTSKAALHWDLLGIYPTYETLLPQVFVLGLIVILWLYGKRPSQKRALIR